MLKREDLIVDLLQVFCTEPPNFPVEVTRLNDLNESDWLLFCSYIKATAKYAWFNPVTIMEVVDTLCDDWVKNSVD